MSKPVIKDQLQYVSPAIKPPPTGGLPSARRIRHIHDAELFKALRLDRPELREVARCARRKDYEGAYEAWRAYVAAKKTIPPELSDELTRQQLAADPARRARVTEDAERLLRHEITGWTGATRKFGKRVRFNCDWGPGGVYGMTYVSWIMPLRSAYLATGDERYAAAFDDLFNQWYEQRDSIKGQDRDSGSYSPVWYELAVGARCRHWSTLYWTFRASPSLSLRTHERLLKAILGNGRWLADYEEKYGYRVANWQMLASMGLLIAGRLWDEFREAADWRRVAVTRFLEHAERDFFADGCFSERITGYGGGCVGRIRQIYDWSASLGMPAAKRRWLRDRLNRMYRFFLLTATPPHGTLAYGDAGYGDATHLLEDGFRTTGDRELLWPIRDSELARKHKPKKPAFTSTVLRPSGFAIMRDGWEADSLFMSVNFGPYGSPHTHSDLLDFDLFAYNTLLAADTTRFGSYGHPLDYTCRRAASHNQIVVEDAQLDRINTRGENVIWSTQDGADFFHAMHRGYEDQFHLLIERTIIFVRGEYWFVSDVIRQPESRYSYTWYLHSPWRWLVNRERVARTQHSPGLLVVPAMAGEIRRVRQGCTFDARDTKGYLQPPCNERHWFGYQKYSFDEEVVSYGAALIPYRSEAPRGVRVRKLPGAPSPPMADPAGVPRGRAEPGAPSPPMADLSGVPRGRAEAFEVLQGRKRDVFIFAHGGGALHRYGEIETDARLALVRFERGRLVGVNAVRASQLSVGGQKLRGARKLADEFSFP